MKIDLSAVEVFADNEIEFDKGITFIFGKNGTGKSTIANRLKNECDYEVSVFQGFSNIIDDNKRLNAVVLGEENATINRQIEAKKIEIEAKNVKIDEIKKTLQNPNDESISNLWTQKEEAEQNYKTMQRKIDDFYSKSASRIKQIDNPRVAITSYNKRNFKDDIADAKVLSEEELNRCNATIKSEIKYAPEIVFPKIDFQALKKQTNNLLKKSVIERVKINRLENNVEKRAFAERGFNIHKKGDVCAFCGSEIKDETWNELASYFSADEVKGFREEINNKINDIESQIKKVHELSIDENNFYPSFINDVKELKQKLDRQKAEAVSYLNRLKEVLDDKLKFLFEACSTVDECCSVDLEDIKEKYKDFRRNNNENSLSEKQQEAKDKVRRHHVKKCLDEFGYNSELSNLDKLEEVKSIRDDEYHKEELKIYELEEEINIIQKEIQILQNGTKNESLLAENINKKLKHMVSFELVHVKDDESKGFYRVKDFINGSIRDITELSTGEKNIIAFLYFIKKLNEIKESPSNKQRIIVFDDPMCSNDDGMQYLIIEDLQRLMKRLLPTDHFILLTHNKHFYLNVKYNHKYSEDRFMRFQSDGRKTHIMIINKKEEDFKTSYESLWSELKTLYELKSVSADLLLNPIRRIIETYTKFNAINKRDFYEPVEGALKLFNVNSHSIDDIEAELNGKTRNEIIQMFYDCFSENGNVDHFKKFWNELKIDEDGRIIFES